MNNAHTKPRRWLVLTAGVLIVGVALPWIITERVRYYAKLELLSGQVTQLQALVKHLEQRLADLREEAVVERDPFALAQPANDLQGSSASATQLELAKQLAQLTATQSNSLSLVQLLLAQAKSPGAPEPVSSATLTVLSNKIAEHATRVDTLTQVMGDLMVNLELPVEVALMEAKEVYARTELRAYWPYFRAKRELETEEFMLERLRARLLQTQVDLATQQAAPRQ